MRQECLTRKDAARFITAHYGLPLSAKTLEKWATTGGGPHFMRSGRRVLYRVPDLHAWFERRTTRPLASTSSVPALPAFWGDQADTKYDLGDMEDSDPYFDEVTRLEEEREFDVALQTKAENSVHNQ